MGPKIFITNLCFGTAILHICNLFFNGKINFFMIKSSILPDTKKKIDSIIFDLGGVLLDVDQQKTINSFKELGVEDFDVLYNRLMKSDLFDRFEKGFTNEREFRDELRRILGDRLTDEQIDRAWNAMLLDFPPERLELLGTLTKHYRLFLLSNTNPIHSEAFEKILLKRFGVNSLSMFFEKVYYSHQLGIKKPDKKNFEFVIKENNLTPRKSLFIDDTLEHVESARSTGLNAVHLNWDMTVTGLFNLSGE